MLIKSTLDQLEASLRQAAFLVGKNAASEVIHDKLISAILLVNELKKIDQSNTHTRREGQPESEASEVNKVKRRLKLWAKRPNQINHQILRAYLHLQSQGKKEITEEDIEPIVQNEASFSTNLIQMRTISEKNHGKVFEQIGSRLVIWPPVEAYVREFEQDIDKLYGCDSAIE